MSKKEPSGVKKTWVDTTKQNLSTTSILYKYPKFPKMSVGLKSGKNFFSQKYTYHIPLGEKFYKKQYLKRN